MEDLDENFTCLFYLDPSLAEGLAEECQANEIYCETWHIGQEKNLRSAEMSISIVRGMEALNYHKTENLFQNSNARIDVTLLKWIVYLITFFFFLGILILFFRRSKKFCTSKWAYLFCSLAWLCYLKWGIFCDTAEFPTWILPGKWSELEGFQALWENVGTQISAIIYFRNYPILCRYYQGLAGCSFSLILCFFSFWALLKNARFLKQLIAPNTL